MVAIFAEAEWSVVGFHIWFVEASVQIQGYIKEDDKFVVNLYFN